MLENAKRLDTQTCKKEGIYFDDVEQAEEASEKHAERDEMKTKRVSQSSADDQEELKRKKEAEKIVKTILNDLIDEVLAKKPEPIVLQSSFLESESNESEEQNLSNSQSSSTSPDNILDRIKDESDSVSLYTTRSTEQSSTVHPLHSHVLLYTQKYDTERTLYALSVIKGVLSSAPRLVTCALSTTSISTVSTPHLLHFQDLLLRHRRSVFGKNFFSTIPVDVTGSSNRSSMFLEVVISVCLYFIRSYYPDLMAAKLTSVELSANKQVQIQSCELLTLLLSELVNIAKDSGKSFSVYVADLFSRCKVQKALLHCLLSSVYNSRTRQRTTSTSSTHPDLLREVTEAIVSFNEDNMDRYTSDSFQAKLLKLVLVLIILEEQIRIAKNEADTTTVHAMSGMDIDKMKLLSIRFNANRPIVTQSMFLCAILSALKQHHHTDMHRHWLTMVTTSMPYVGRSLASILVPVINQLCKNIEIIAELYELDNLTPV